MDIRSAFAILGLDERASQQQVRDAYRDLVKVWHPDRFAHDPSLQAKATETLRQVNEAYQVATTRTATPEPPPAVAIPPTYYAPHPHQRTLFCLAIVAGATLVLSVFGMPWTAATQPFEDLLDLGTVTVGAIHSRAFGPERSYLEEPIASDTTESAATPASSWYASTSQGLSTNVEGSWLLNGKRLTFRQGTIRAAGTSADAALGYYDPSTPQTLLYRNARSALRVLVEVQFTPSSMRWFVRDAGRRLVYEFVRVS